MHWWYNDVGLWWSAGNWCFLVSAAPFGQWIHAWNSRGCVIKPSLTASQTLGVTHQVERICRRLWTVHSVLRSFLLVVLYCSSLKCACSDCSKSPWKLVVTFICLTTACLSAQEPVRSCCPISAKYTEFSVNLCFTWFPLVLFVLAVACESLAAAAYLTHFPTFCVWSYSF